MRRRCARHSMAVSILKYRIISVNARSPDAGRGPAAVHFQESAAGFHKNQLQASKSERFGRENRFTPTYATAPGEPRAPDSGQFSSSNFRPIFTICRPIDTISSLRILPPPEKLHGTSLRPTRISRPTRGPGLPVHASGRRTWWNHVHTGGRPACS